MHLQLPCYAVTRDGAVRIDAVRQSVDSSLTLHTDVLTGATLPAFSAHFDVVWRCVLKRDEREICFLELQCDAASDSGDPTDADAVDDVALGVHLTRIVERTVLRAELDANAAAGTTIWRFGGRLSTAMQACESLVRYKRWEGYSVASAKVSRLLTSRLLNDKIARLLARVFAAGACQLERLCRDGAVIPARGVDGSQLARAEAALLALQAAQRRNAAREDVESLLAAFYTDYPLTRAAPKNDAITSAAQFAEHFELLQMLRDFRRCGEQLGSQSDVELAQLYQAFDCRVEWLAPDESERASIVDAVLGDRWAVRRRDTAAAAAAATATAAPPHHDSVEVVNVFRVVRAADARAGAERANDSGGSAVGNERLLFHGTRASNVGGVLLRGLVKPHLATRRQRAELAESPAGELLALGWLGNALYFGDRIETSLAYANVLGDDVARSAADEDDAASRFVFVCRVELGRVFDTVDLMTGVDQAPDGYDSVCGRAGAVFPADEFAVYDASRVQLAYLLEVKRVAAPPAPADAPSDAVAALLADTSAPLRPSLVEVAGDGALRSPLVCASLAELGEAVGVAAVPMPMRKYILRELAREVARVHGESLLHGQLSDANVLVYADGSVRLGAMATCVSVDASGATVAAAAPLTAFSAPEEVAGSVSQASDVWSLGVCAYWLLSGGRTPVSAVANDKLPLRTVLRRFNDASDAALQCECGGDAHVRAWLATLLVPDGAARASARDAASGALALAAFRKKIAARHQFIAWFSATVLRRRRAAREAQLAAASAAKRAATLGVERKLAEQYGRRQQRQAERDARRERRERSGAAQSTQLMQRVAGEAAGIGVASSRSGVGATAPVSSAEREADKESDAGDDDDEGNDPLARVKGGLFGTTASGARAVLPLRAVAVRAACVDMVARVELLQEYFNESDETIEAKYVFPLDEKAAVCGFEALIGAKRIVGRVKEKEKARREYKEAVERGHGAFLMEQDEPNVFTVSVGNLPPRTVVIVRIAYVSELTLRTESNAVQLRVPRRLLDMPASVVTQTVTSTATSGAAGGAAAASLAFSMRVSVAMPAIIRSISSATHTLRVKQTSTRAVVDVPATAMASSARDFRLEIAVTNASAPRFWIERNDAIEREWRARLVEEAAEKAADAERARAAELGLRDVERDYSQYEAAAAPSDGPLESALVSDMLATAAADSDAARSADISHAALVAFYPQLRDATIDARSNEIVFLVDLSASMQAVAADLGEWIELAMCLVDDGTLVNVVGFGSAVTSAFVQSRACNDDVRWQAIAYAREWARDTASGGASALGSVLRALYALPVPSGRVRNVVLLTDGDIDDGADVLALVREHDERARRSTSDGVVRLFPTAVRMSAKQSIDSVMLGALARVGRGNAVEVEAARWRVELARQVRRAAQLAYADVHIEWGTAHGPLPAGAVVQAPAVVPSLFAGDRVAVMAFVPPACDRVRLRASVGEAVLDETLLSDDVFAVHGETIHRLAARARIREFESAESAYADDRVHDALARLELRSVITELGCKYTLVTQQTSFVAVEKRSAAEQLAYATAGGDGDGGAEPGAALERLSPSDAYDILPYNKRWATEAPGTALSTAAAAAAARSNAELRANAAARRVDGMLARAIERLQQLNRKRMREDVRFDVMRPLWVRAPAVLDDDEQDPAIDYPAETRLVAANVAEEARLLAADIREEASAVVAAEQLASQGVYDEEPPFAPSAPPVLSDRVHGFVAKFGGGRNKLALGGDAFGDNGDIGGGGGGRGGEWNAPYGGAPPGAGPVPAMRGRGAPKGGKSGAVTFAKKSRKMASPMSLSTMSSASAAPMTQSMAYFEHSRVASEDADEGFDGFTYDQRLASNEDDVRRVLSSSSNDNNNNNNVKAKPAKNLHRRGSVEGGKSRKRDEFDGNESDGTMLLAKTVSKPVAPSVVSDAKDGKEMMKKEEPKKGKAMPAKDSGLKEKEKEKKAKANSGKRMEQREERKVMKDEEERASPVSSRAPPPPPAQPSELQQQKQQQRQQEPRSPAPSRTVRELDVDSDKKRDRKRSKKSPMGNSMFAKADMAPELSMMSGEANMRGEVAAGSTGGARGYDAADIEALHSIMNENIDSLLERHDAILNMEEAQYQSHRFMSKSKKMGGGGAGIGCACFICVCLILCLCVCVIGAIVGGVLGAQAAAEAEAEEMMAMTETTVATVVTSIVANVATTMTTQ